MVANRQKLVQIILKKSSEKNNCQVFMNLGPHAELYLGGQSEAHCSQSNKDMGVYNKVNYSQSKGIWIGSRFPGLSIINSESLKMQPSVR